MILRQVSLKFWIKSLFGNSLKYNELSPYLQQLHLSNLKTLYLAAISLSEQIEILITQTFTKYKLHGKLLRKFTYSLRILSDLSEICGHLYQAHLVLIEIDSTLEEFMTLRNLWINTLYQNLSQMFHHFLKTYTKSNLDLDQVDTDFEVINTLESNCDKIYSDHIPSIINMSKAKLLTVSEAFQITSVIRYFERAADLIFEVIIYSYNIHTRDLTYLFSLKSSSSQEPNTHQ